MTCWSCQRRWFSGKISRCQRDAPGSIPGRRRNWLRLRIWNCEIRSYAAYRKHIGESHASFNKPMLFQLSECWSALTLTVKIMRQDEWDWHHSRRWHPQELLKCSTVFVPFERWQRAITRTLRIRWLIDPASAVDLVVKYLVASEVPRVRFPDGAEIDYNFWDVCGFEIAKCSHMQLTEII